MRVLSSASLVTFFLSAMAAAAAPVTYTCALKDEQKNTWIPQQLVIQHDAASNTVIVNDPVIMNFLGQPVAGRVDVDNEKRVTFLWELSCAKDAGGQFIPRFLYRATIIKATNVVSVAATPAGYSNTFEGRGTCGLG